MGFENNKTCGKPNKTRAGCLLTETRHNVGGYIFLITKKKVLPANTLQCDANTFLAAPFGTGPSQNGFEGTDVLFCRFMKFKVKE